MMVFYEKIGRGLPVHPEQIEAALVELRELEWRAPGHLRVGFSSRAGDGPWHLAQREVGDIAGEYSQTLIVNESGKELEVRKLDSQRPRTPLRASEVDRLEQLYGWLQLLPDPLDRRILWGASWYLMRGVQIEWAELARSIGYDRSTRRLAGRYREALCKLVCRVQGVPMRHYRQMLHR